ncbi:hypothetical protein Tco_1476419 [Tanacetum coccineum]
MFAITQVCKSKYKEARLIIRFKSPIQAIDSLIKEESDLDISESGGMGGGCGDTSGNAPPKAWQKDVVGELSTIFPYTVVPTGAT